MIFYPNNSAVILQDQDRAELILKSCFSTCQGKHKTKTRTWYWEAPSLMGNLQGKSTSVCRKSQVDLSCLKIGFSACFDTCFLKKGDITSELKEASSSVNSCNTRRRQMLNKLLLFPPQVHAGQGGGRPLLKREKSRDPFHAQRF